MHNIISGKTLLQVVTECGLDGAQQFTTRCTGYTTGQALALIGDVMKKHSSSAGQPVHTYCQDREVVRRAQELIVQLDLKGFVRDPVGSRGGYLEYHVFKEAKD